MEIFNLPKDVAVFGIEVKDFPAGVGEAFQKLTEMITDQYDRSYYGIIKMTENGMLYIAAAEEKNENESEKYHCQKYIVDKGDYLVSVLRDWRKKTDCIKDVFHEMMLDNHDHKTGACLEWYKNDEEMFCMMKIIEQ